MPRLFTTFEALDALESEYQGWKGSAAIQGVGDETGFVATVNTCQGDGFVCDLICSTLS